MVGSMGAAGKIVVDGESLVTVWTQPVKTAPVKMAEMINVRSGIFFMAAI
jgi:hypothetical protein